MASEAFRDPAPAICATPDGRGEQVPESQRRHEKDWI